MESNGKSVTLDGPPVEWPTAAVIWGEPGNNAQHSFFQLLHQGTPRAALDFLLPARSSCGNQAQQDLAIASCLAQAEAFTNGQIAATGARRTSTHAGAARGSGSTSSFRTRCIRAAGPRTLVVFQQLDPATLGRLIALYEHKVFTQGVVWGINSFDQWGVELGKKLTDQLAPAVQDPAGGHPAPAVSASSSPASISGAAERGSGVHHSRLAPGLRA